MLIQLLIGALVVAALWILFNYVSKRGIKILWWQWGITALGVLYAAFVVEVIVAFIQEGLLQGALVMGLATGIVAVVWGVLLSRFVFVKAS